MLRVDLPLLRNGPIDGMLGWDRLSGAVVSNYSHFESNKDDTTRLDRYIYTRKYMIATKVDPYCTSCLSIGQSRLQFGTPIEIIGRMVFAMPPLLSPTRDQLALGENGTIMTGISIYVLRNLERIRQRACTCLVA